MKRFGSLLICGAFAGVIGCKKEATFTEPLPDYAAIHWVNAVPDTGQQDMRVVDVPSNAGLFDANFRGVKSMFYEPILAGSRTIEIFNSSTDPVISSQVLAQATQNFVVSSAYTFIHAGFARTGFTPAHAVLVIQDAPPTPDTLSIAFRAINVGAGLGPVDVWAVRRPVNALTVDSLPDARGAANVAYGTASAYVTIAKDVAGADSVRIVFTTAGTKTVLAAVLAPPGVVGSTSLDPIAGSRIGGSVLTAVLVPRSVAGSQAPAGFTTPSMLYLVDRRPPGTAR